MICRNNYLLLKDFLKSMDSNPKIDRTSISRYECYLRHLIIWADEIPFSLANTIEQPLFKHVQQLPGKNGVGVVSAETIKKIMNLSKQFLSWAKAEYESDFTTLPQKWIDHLEAPRVLKDLMTAHDYVSYEEIQKIANAQIPTQNLSLLRDQAAACLLFLNGARAGAFTTLPIQAIDLNNRTVVQSPKLGVHTKNSKAEITFLFPISELLKPIQNWDNIVRGSLPPNAAWYAPIEQSWGANHKLLAETGENRNISLDKRLRELYEFVGLGYKSAHKFRHGHAVYGITLSRTMAQFQSVSRNLMHANISITDEIYASINHEERHRFFDQIVNNVASAPDDELTEYLSHLSKGDLARAIQIAAQLAIM